MTAVTEAPRSTLPQAKAWLATVIAPIAEALRVEDGWLASGNPSLRVYAQELAFEFLWDSRMMVSRRYEPNMRQLFKHYPEIATAVAEHDEGIKQLMQACSDAFEALLRSPNFERLCATVPPVIQSGFSQLMIEQEKRSIAGEVINGQKQLDGHYPLSGLWNSYADQFLALRSEPALKPRFEAVERALTELRERVRGLGSKMSTFQERLAEEHGLPAVDPDLVERL